jgi:hypothetical protein
LRGFKLMPCRLRCSPCRLPVTLSALLCGHSAP